MPATGTPGADYHPVGNAICRMFNLPRERADKPCVAVGSGAGVGVGAASLGGGVGSIAPTGGANSVTRPRSDSTAYLTPRDAAYAPQYARP